MDYTTLTVKGPSVTNEESLPLISLYEVLQALSSGETLRACVDPLFVRAGQTGRTKELMWSNGMAASSQSHSRCTLWVTPNESALSDDLL